MALGEMARDGKQQKGGEDSYSVIALHAWPVLGDFPSETGKNA